jgi:G3E family GTPase
MQKPFDQLLDMQACICLVDPRHLQDARYLENEIYQQQLHIADVVVANKTDLCSDNDRNAFGQLVQSLDIQASGWVDHGKLDITWTGLPHSSEPDKTRHFLTTIPDLSEELQEIQLNKNERLRRLENNSSEYSSCGWLFSKELKFDFNCISDLFGKLEAERIKATLNTDKGTIIFNNSDRKISAVQGNSTLENRVEMISLKETDWSRIEIQLLSCCKSV